MKTVLNIQFSVLYPHTFAYKYENLYQGQGKSMKEEYNVFFLNFQFSSLGGLNFFPIRRT